MALCFIKPKLLLIIVLHCGNRYFRPLCFGDLDLDPMTFIYDLDPYSLEIYRMYKYELPISQSFRNLSSDRQTERQTRPKLYTTLFRGWFKCTFFTHVQRAMVMEPNGHSNLVLYVLIYLDPCLEFLNRNLNPHSALSNDVK